MNILAQLARRIFRSRHEIKNQTEVDEFYREIKTPFELRERLNLMDFRWRGELSWFDWNKTPEETLAVKERQINCGDFMELYMELYERIDIDFHCYLLEDESFWSWKYDWHYVSVFRWDDELWVQSNNGLFKLPLHHITPLYTFPKYTHSTLLHYNTLELKHSKQSL